MQNFTIAGRTDRSLVGDFQITPAASHSASSEERDYINRLNQALDKLAADAAADQKELAAPEVFDARKKARETAATSLRSLADEDFSFHEIDGKVEGIQQAYQTELQNIPEPEPKFRTNLDDSLFSGYFTIEPNYFFYNLTDDDKNYIKRVQKLLTIFYEDAVKDQESRDADSPRTRAHAEVRNGAAISMKFEADRFASFGTTSESSIAAQDAIKQRYDAEIVKIDEPKFEIEERPDPRFPGDFGIKLRDESEPTRDHHAYVARVREILRDLAADEIADEARNFPPAVLEKRRALRKETAEGLKSDADRVSKGRLQVVAGSNDASTAKGIYLRNLQLASATLFTIGMEKKEERPIGLIIKVAPDLPPPNNVASPEKQDLYTAILGAQTVITTVCNRVASGDDSTLCGRLFARQQTSTGPQRANVLRENYLGRLAEIGEIGLRGSNTALARVALDSLRKEFVADEGPRIKNSYVCRLGLACGIAAAVFLLVYVAITSGVEHPFWKLHKPFLLAGTGAAIGTWLSFSIREVELSFDHLGVVEADLLDPAFRVLFVVALTITACLLFWTGVMNIEIGSLKTTAGAFEKAGTIPLLIGLFCGISERALATSISGRAATFVKGVSGGA